ncbi:LCP family protein, partial [Streptomyces sp. JW3]
MDAQGRGRADDIDPADQWVLNPHTGEYELRLTPSAPQPSVPGPRRSAPSNPSAPAPSAAAPSAVGGPGVADAPRGRRAAPAPGPE